MRHIRDLKISANSDEPLALYSLAVYYDQGKFLEEDKKSAQEFYCRAANAGNDLAKHIYGIMLYYGTETLEIDKELGLSFLNSSAENGVEDAKIFLDSIK